MLYLALTVVVVGCATVVWWLRSRLVEPAGAPPLVYYEGSRFKAARMLREDPETLLKWARPKYGDVFTVDFIFFRQTVILDYDGIDFVYLTKEDKLSFYEMIKIGIKSLLGPDAVKDRPEHEQLERAQKVGATLAKHKKVFFGNIKQEAEEWAAALAAAGKPFDFYAAANDLITRVNIHCFIGQELREKHCDSFKELYDELEVKGVSVPAILFGWLPFGPGERCRQIRKQIRAILEPIIVERQRRFKELGEQREDYLNEYVTSTHKVSKEPWTCAEMIERMLSVFFAARINSLRSLFWTAANIAVRPDYIQKVRECVGDDLNFETMKEMRFLDCCVKESVRPWYSVMPFARKTTQPVPYKQFIIPKGYIVGNSMYFVNRDPELFPEPEKFVPERWLETDPQTPTEGNPKGKNPWAFFGGGRHRCKGEDFAYMVLRTCLAVIFANYDLTLTDLKEGELPPPDMVPGLPRPKGVVLATLTPRKPERWTEHK